MSAAVQFRPGSASHKDDSAAEPMLNEAFIKCSLQSDGVPGFLEDLAAKRAAEALRTKAWSAGSAIADCRTRNR